MTYELTRAIVVAHLRLAMEQVADANAEAEKRTDAGTRELVKWDEGPDPDLAYDRMREKEDGDA